MNEVEQQAHNVPMDPLVPSANNGRYIRARAGHLRDWDAIRGNRRAPPARPLGGPRPTHGPPDLVRGHEAVEDMEGVQPEPTISSANRVTVEALDVE